MASTAGRGERVTAVLGPTNTGKTYFAIERMLAHRSGMIGLPLRLLAREVYDKIVRIKGASDVALITGEERLVPLRPRYYVCTVEAMPMDISVAFLAVDEIQLCADPERGHVFTDRLIHARGEEETLFLGAGTMRTAIARIAPHAHFISRPRLSELTYTGTKKITRLPRRSVVVAFSAEDVYGLADLIRQQRGGAAVVIGALSPRTRNAQVALYQSGDADFLVATDAIGMGINMDVDHVAFSAREKFDGSTMRPLRPDEMGQIAGRAGRFMNDGTFGVTADADVLDNDLVVRIENHRYDSVRVLQWRNSALDFRSLSALLASLALSPPARGLVKARPSSDHVTLHALARDETTRINAASPAALRILWQACQLPNFRKLAPEDHAGLVAEIFRHLIGPSASLPADWIARQLSRLDTIEGDVDTLSARLAQIRTWTYAAHMPGWTRDPAHWQGVTRAIEDRLSDALHERLTQRFIDRRTSILMRHLRDDETLSPAVDASGAVSLGGEYVGKLDGFRFAPDPRAEGIHGRTLRAAAQKGLENEIAARARAVAVAKDGELSLSAQGRLSWNGSVIATLAAGAHPLAPRVHITADTHLRGADRDIVCARLEMWMNTHVASRLAPLIALREAVSARHGPLPGHARGIAFQLTENMGSVDRRAAMLPHDIRPVATALRRYGVRIGRHTIFLPQLVKPSPAALAALLWAIHTRLEKIPPLPAPGLTSLPAGDYPRGFLEAAGFRTVGARAVRFDILERIEEILVRDARRGAAADTLLPQVISLLGCAESDAQEIIKGLGWCRDHEGGAEEQAPRAVWRRRPPRNARARKARPGPDSPFAGLASLIRE